MKPAIVADDEETVRGFVKRLIGIASPGREVHEVGDGKGLVEKVRVGDYAFVITDNVMPRMNGLEAVAEIRKFSEIPVCLMSGTVGEEEARKAGATDYIGKPYDFEKFVGIIRKYDKMNGNRKEE